MKTRVILALVLCMVVLILAGCSGQAPAASATSAPAPAGESASAAPTAAATSKTGSQSTPTAVEEATPAEESLSLSSREEALDKLSSYRMRWQAEWKSTQDGTAKTASWDWMEEYTVDPKALHWVWTSVDAEQNEQETMETWQIGDTMYMKTGEGEDCISISSQDDSSQLTKGLFSPNTLGTLEGAKYAGRETVNGVPSKHYTYDEKSLALIGFSKVSGEIWVAVDGGFVVKDVMQWKGSAGLFGIGTSSEGEGKWTWQLSDVNQPIAITPPENCGGAAGELPILPDAVDKSSFGDIVSYTSATKLDDAVTFYKDEMKAAGWSLDGEPTSFGQMSMLTFTKDDQTAQVTITEDEGKTTVMISVSK